MSKFLTFPCTMNFLEDPNLLACLLWETLSKNRAKTCGDLLSLLSLDVTDASQLLSQTNAFQLPLQQLNWEDTELTCVLVQVPTWGSQHHLLLLYCFLQNSPSFFLSLCHLSPLGAPKLVCACESSCSSWQGHSAAKVIIFPLPANGLCLHIHTPHKAAKSRNWKI